MSDAKERERGRQQEVNEGQYATAMLSALTANINRAEKTEPISHNCFLRYPAADTPVIPDLDSDSAAVSLAVVPTQELASNMLAMRERLSATYLWQSNKWLFS